MPRFDFERFSRPEPDTFKSICHEMYKCFGGAAKNLQVLARDESERNLLTAQLHELRDKVRELMEKIKEVPKDD